MRPLLAFLFILALPAAAQPAPVVANAPGAGAAFAHSGGEPVPDTTAPWRYYPLEVGNVWEYAERDWHGDATGRTFRRHISGDTLAPNGHRYYFIEIAYLSDGAREAAGSFIAVRYDTVSTRVLELYPGGIEAWTYEAPCPFDAPFNSVAECTAPDKYMAVTGGYDGILDFEPDTTVVGVPYKTYEGTADLIRYAAGFGEIVYLQIKGLYQYVLRACRVGGVEYGTLQYPVASEAPPKEFGRAIAVEAWPNPFRDKVTIALELPSPQEVTLRVTDMLGRLAHRQALGVLPEGSHEVILDGFSLSGGLYLVEVLTTAGRIGTVKLLHTR